MNALTTDVLVVGAGPAGLTMAALLAKYGVSAITVTKHKGTAHSPRAHITNQRAMEVFRDLGASEAVRAVGTSREYMRNNVWATSFAGQEIARLESWGAGDQRRSDYDLASPEEMCNVPQHRLEPVLRQTADEYGADIRFMHEVVQIQQDEDGVHALVRHRETGDHINIRSKYVVGADGGNSIVGKQLGIEYAGEAGLGAALNIWLEADLSKYCEYRLGTLFWMAQPGNDYWVGSGTWINVTPFTEWVLLCMYDPDEGEPDCSEQALIERAQLTIGDPDVEVKIKEVSKWQINHINATSYQVGRAFVVGDAAHRHPPANGLGTNTSVQDSFNLAWKLAAVLKGTAGKGLLDTYSEERQPVGQQVVDRALKSVGDMQPISEALGFYPGQSEEEGWDSLNRLFSAGEKNAARRNKLRKAIELQHYQFNAHGVEMGQVYASSAVLNTNPGYPGADAGTISDGTDPELTFTAMVQPGHHLPHAWIDSNRERLSTLDLVGDGRFTLIVGADHSRWSGAEELAAELGITLRVVEIGLGLKNSDVTGRWEQLRGVSDEGAILVRPDRYIAGVFENGTASDVLDALRALLSRNDAGFAKAGGQKPATLAAAG